MTQNKDQDSNSQGDGRGASMAPINDGAVANSGNEPKIDDRGTDQPESLEILMAIRDGAFNSSNEKLALALGRQTEEIEEWLGGEGTIDGDVMQKARALAIERGVQVE
jgi:hypothetical protein